MRSYDVSPVEGYDPQVGLLLATLDDSTREWRENLGQPPVEAITWRPAEGFHSIGALILHMIDTEVYWLEEFAAGKKMSDEETRLLMVQEIKQDDVQWPRPHAEPIEWYYDLHDRTRQRVVEAIRGMPPETRLGGEEFACTLRWTLAHVAEHDAYHGGQAVMLHELWKRIARVQT
jgi:uncharacterized damage-inducible protein DinB